MLCLRCRALPTMRTPLSSIQTPLNRTTQFTPHFQKQTTTPSRQFSSLLSTPTRFQQTQTHPRLPSTSSTPITPITPLLSQQTQTQRNTQQTRSFSATASLGVRRVTFRPSRRVQKRRHGFLSRNKAKKGRMTVTRRRLKGRKNVGW